MSEYEITWPSDLKKTKQRVLVMNALRESKKPVSAREIFNILQNSGNPIWFSTIYRVLDTFLERGLILKAAVYENGMAVYELNDGHRHYAVCLGCSRIIALRGCPLKSFPDDLQDFHVVGHRLQISGYCGDCYGKL